jgi:helicase
LVIDRKFTSFPEGQPLNPMQELVVAHMDSLDNILVASPTASGKSTVINMVGHKYLEDGGNIVYIGSMKALVEEKRMDWESPDHVWFSLPKAVITGDYEKNASKQREIDEARIIVITPESLSSYLRKLKSDAGKFLFRTGLLVVDEIHLVGQAGRGDNLEAALMEFCYEFPNAQILALSATLPNVADIQAWMSNLNGKPTTLIKSDYRPVPLVYHYVPCEDDDDRRRLISQIIQEKSDQQHLVGIFNKNFGDVVLNDLNRLGIPADFHNANQTKGARARMESAFKRGDLRALLGTSGVFTGVNYPARNVIISATKNNFVTFDTFELQQLAGRAGRPKYDTEGDVYVLTSEETLAIDKHRLENGEAIRSQLIAPEVCATHFLGAVYLGRVKTRKDFLEWYRGSLAFVQNKLSDSQINSILNSILVSMQQQGMVRVENHREVALTKRGAICAQMLFDPYDLFGYCMNFHKLFQIKKPTDIDWVAALASVNSNRSYCSNKEKNEVPEAIKKTLNEVYWKMGTVIYQRMRKQQIPYGFMNVHFQLMQDISRVEQVLIRVCQESEGWNAKSDIQEFFTRIKQQVGWDEAKLMRQNFKRNEIRQMYGQGLQRYEDIVGNRSVIARKIGEQ